MNRILKHLLLLITLPALLVTGCKREGGDEFTMVARVVAMDEKIEVEVLESEYTSGVHLVITHKNTVYKTKSGKKISRNDIKAGDIIEIRYNGQVMLSYPPQIVAHVIIK